MFSEVRSLTNFQLWFSAGKCAPRCFLPALPVQWLLEVGVHFDSGEVIPLWYLIALPMTNPLWDLQVPYQLVRLDFQVNIPVAAVYLGIAETESGFHSGLWLGHVASWFICRCVCHHFPVCTFHCAQSIIVDSAPCALAAASLCYWWMSFMMLCSYTSHMLNVHGRSCCDSSTDIPLFQDHYSTKDHAHRASWCAVSAL